MVTISREHFDQFPHLLLNRNLRIKTNAELERRPFGSFEKRSQIPKGRCATLVRHHVIEEAIDTLIERPQNFCTKRIAPDFTLRKIIEPLDHLRRIVGRQPRNVVRPNHFTSGDVSSYGRQNHGDHAKRGRPY